MFSENLYEPREDSFLILKHLKSYIKPKDKVLDMGTGTGILAQEATKYASCISAVDANKKLIKKLINTLKAKNKKIKFIYSNLF